MTQSLGSLLKEGRWNYCPRCDTQTMTRTSENQWDCAMCGLSLMWVEPPPVIIWSDALTLVEMQRENDALSAMMASAPVPEPPPPEPEKLPWRVRWSFKIGEVVMWPLSCFPREIRDKKYKKEVNHEQS